MRKAPGSAGGRIQRNGGSRKRQRSREGGVPARFSRSASGPRQGGGGGAGPTTGGGGAGALTPLQPRPRPPVSPASPVAFSNTWSQGELKHGHEGRDGLGISRPPLQRPEPRLLRSGGGGGGGGQVGANFARQGWQSAGADDAFTETTSENSTDTYYQSGGAIRGAPLVKTQTRPKVLTSFLRNFLEDDLGTFKDRVDLTMHAEDSGSAM